MLDEPRPPTNGDGRYVSWRDWATQRGYISREIEAAVIASEEREAEIVRIVKNLVDEHGRQIGALQQVLVAPPDGDKPGGLMWQVGEGRAEQKRFARTIIVSLGAIVAVVNFIAPYFQGAVEAIFKIPKP